MWYNGTVMETMRLFIIALPTQKTTIGLLTEACQTLNVDYEILNPDEVAPIDVMVKPGDMVYRVSDASHYGCLELEYDLIKRGAVSFYKNNDIIKSLVLVVYYITKRLVLYTLYGYVKNGI